jgi:hypothetical protein
MEHQIDPVLESEVNEALSVINKMLEGKRLPLVISIAGSLYVRVIACFVSSVPKEDAESTIQLLAGGHQILNEELDRIFTEKRKQILDS